MKKKTLLFGTALMFTAMFFTAGCSKTVDSLTTQVCTVCIENTTQISLGEICNIESFIISYEANLGTGYTCTRQ